MGVATLLLDAGTPLDRAQKFPRHERIATTQIYAEISAKKRRKPERCCSSGKKRRKPESGLSPLAA